MAGGVPGGSGTEQELNDGLLLRVHGHWVARFAVEVGRVWQVRARMWGQPCGE